jgi:MFS family permease
MNMHRLEKNIPLFYVYQLFNSFILDRGIWMLYLGLRGFSLTDIGIIEALYHAVIFLFEVPTGAIADRYGKRVSLMLSHALGIIAALCLMLAQGQPLIIFGFLLSALVGTLQSGATGALVYETLKTQGKESGFKRLNSHLSAIVLIAMGLSGSLGGLLSGFHWEWVYLGKIGMHGVSLIIAWAIAEPPIHKRLTSSSDAYRTKSHYFENQLREGFMFIRTNRPFLTLSLFGAFLYSMSWSISFYSQVLFQKNGLSNATIGTINGLETWVAAGITAVAYMGERWLGSKGSLLLSVIGFTISLLIFSGSKGSWMVIGSFFLLSVFISYLEPLLEAYLQELVPSFMRATMLSVFNMMVSSGMMITFFTMGYLGDRTGISEALQIMLWIWVPLQLALTVWCLLYHSENKDPKEH